MGIKHLLDSNVIIDFCNGKLPVAGRKLLEATEPEMSIITQIELFATTNITREEFSLLEQFTAISVVHPVTTDLVTTTIKIRQEYRLKLPDAIIAATAIVHNIPLISRNSSDFKKVNELVLIDPYFI